MASNSGGLSIKSRPVMYDLCTVWNLPVHISSTLVAHKLVRMTSVELFAALSAGDDAFPWCGKLFVPIYQNVSRQDIIRDNSLDKLQHTPSRYYWLSIRADNSIAFVLIQKDTKKK